MARTVLAPAGLSFISNTGGWKDQWNNVADGSNIDVLQDALDSTYLMTYSSTAGLLILDAGPYTLASNERLRSVALKVRESFTGGRHRHVLAIDGTELPASQIVFPMITERWIFGGPPSIRTWDGPKATKNASNTELVQADIDDLQAKFDSTGSSIQLAQALVVYEVQTKAVPIVTVGSGTPRVLVNCKVSWETGDTDAQREYHLKIFTKAEGDDVGFDPDTSPTVFNSGERFSANRYHTFSLEDTPLDLGEDYYALVRMGADFNGETWWSDWSAKKAFSTCFEVNLTVTDPTGTVTDSAKPLIKWEIDDPNGDYPGAYDVRLFTEEQYTDTEFDIDETQPYWATKAPVSPFYLQVEPPYLENMVTYRAYVRVTSRDLGIVSDWEYAEFDLDLVPPTPPLLTVTADLVNARVHVEAELADLDMAPLTLEVWKSADGVNFTELTRLGEEDPIDGYDNYPPFYSEVTYRAYSVTYESGSLVRSDPTDETITLEVSKVWIKSVEKPALNTSFMVADTWLSSTHTRTRTSFRGLGAQKPKVVRGSAKYQSFVLNFLVLDPAVLDQFYKIMDAPGTLCIMTGNSNRFVELNGDITVSEQLWARKRKQKQAWQVSAPFVEVGYVE